MLHVSIGPTNEEQQEILESLENLAISGVNQGIYKITATTFGNRTFGESGTTTWGSITGTLSNQTDLQAALDAKGSGSVTSVAMSVPTGLTISGSPITGAGTLAVALDTGYVIPLQTTIDGKASTTLNNLGTTAINTSLISDTDSTDSLGSTTVRWLKGWFDDVESTSMYTVGGTSLSSTFSPIAGSASIVTVGTITSGVWQGTTIKANYLQQAAADLGDADITLDLSNSNVGNVTNLTIDGVFQAGGIGVTGTRIATGFFTDLTVTNAISGSITGNAGTASAVAVGGITGLGTGVATALAVNVGSAGTFITFNGDAGTPSALVGTNISGTATNLTAGNATLAATVASANEATDTTCFILFQTASGTTSLATKNNTGLTYNSNTNAVGATTFVGALTGIASGNALTTTTITIAGTANQITSSAGAQDLSANRTWTLSFPSDLIIPTVLTVPNTGLHLLDTNASHDLIIAPGSDLTADHTLTLTTGDSDRTITLSGNPTLADWFDQAVKTTSNPTFGNLTITSFAGNWTNAGRTVADLGTVTTVDINGGTIDGTTIGASSATTIIGTTIDATTDFTVGTTVITDDSIVMGTTGALLNTDSTTVNAFGAATTLNIGASATCILNFGGSTTASEFRFLEPSASGTNYTAFKAQAQAASVTYTLPNAVAAATGYVLSSTDAGVLSWIAAGAGDVIKVGTPANNQVGVWTGDGTIEGDAALTYDSTTDTLTSVTFAGALTGHASLDLALTGGTMSGNILMGENTNILLDPALSADGKYSSIESETGTLGETVAFGEGVYFKAADSQWYKWDASSTTTSGVRVGVCVVAGNDNDATTILFKGNIRADALFPGFTIAGQVYISEIAGAMVQTAPTTTDSVIRVVGYAETADSVDVDISRDWITHV